jgi:hypothetical protein
MGRTGLHRLQEHLVPLGGSLSGEKTKMANLLNGESFGYLGFDFRRVQNRRKSGYFILMTPKKKACKAIRAKIRHIITLGGASSIEKIVGRINPVLAGWVNYFRVGNSNCAFSEVRDYLEMKIRTLLSRRKRRQKRSIGWRRWNTEYLYGVLGLYWGWKVKPLGNVEAYS